MSLAHAGLTVGGRPSLASWRRLTAALDDVTSAGLAPELLAVEAACAGWPDALRLAPGRWLRTRLEGRPEPRLQVARAVDLELVGAKVADRHAWADAPELAAATVLRVHDERASAGLDRWLAGPNNATCRELTLALGLGDADVARLVEDPRLAGVRRLGLFRNAIGPPGLAALLASPRLGSLRALLLGRNQLGEPGAAALAGATALRGLDLLDLDCDRLGGPAIATLADAPLLADVRVLNLSNNPIGSAGCAALAGSSRLGALEVLYLHGCDLDDDAVAELARAPWLARLRNLALSANRLTMRTVGRLADLCGHELAELDICHNSFSATQAEPVLRAAPRLAGLGRLCL